jgi:glucose/arabinose dehydrogenase
LVALAALVPAAVAGAHRDRSHDSDKSPEVVASGLDNPRGLDIGAWGTIYVTEAGRGGDGPCLTGPEGDSVCAGATGAVTAASHGKQWRIVDGLPSIAAPGGNGALGPSDISIPRSGDAYLTVGLGADPAARAALGDLGPGFGQLYKLSRHGRLRTVADIAGFEATENPDLGEHDSNPHSVLSAWGRQVVVDAGGNSLLSVGWSGKVSTLAVFPQASADAPQAVPTSVVVGPDGALYVGQLTGFPFIKGTANVFRIVPGKAPEVYAGGFTNITGIEFDRRGNLYVLEFAANGIMSGDPAGALIKVRRDGSRETVASEGLVSPTGIAISRSGDIYVSNHGAEAGAGEVLRFSR